LCAMWAMRSRRCLRFLALAMASAGAAFSVFHATVSRRSDALGPCGPQLISAHLQRGPSRLGRFQIWQTLSLGAASLVVCATRPTYHRRLRTPTVGKSSLGTLQPGDVNKSAKPASARGSDFEELMARLVGAPEGPTELSAADYSCFVSEAQEQMRSFATLAKESGPFTLNQADNAGSIYGIGRREYQQRHGRLDLSRFRGVMSFDPLARNVTVGAKTDFKSLTRYLLERGSIVPIVPEVDTVTVGGAISGVVMEAASFRYGFVHNTVQSMEVLLPSGEVVKCSRDENMELFRSLPHSYGTLGYVLSATLLTIPAEQDVLVQVQELPSPKDAVEGISKAAKDPSTDFVEGIIFGEDRALAMTVSMCPPASLGINIPTVILPDDGRYIDVVCKQLDANRVDWHSKNISCSFRMSTFDFLYRWDCDIFWATRRTGFLGVPSVRKALGRACLRSKVLWPVGTFLRGTKEAFSELAWSIFGEAGLQLGFKKPTERIIQDLGVRFDQVPAFAKDLEAHAELPFWMCPIRCRNLTEEQPLFPLPEDVDYVMDVASFGAVAQESGDPLFHNRGIEKVLQKYDGMKAFYSDVLYPREYIYEKFNGELYDRMKAKFDPDGVLPRLVDKVLTA